MVPLYFYNKKDFSFNALLEDNYKVILGELLSIMTKSDSLNQHWNASHPHYVQSEAGFSWKTFTFLFFGIQNEENAKLCPKTSELLQQIPELITAQFSLLLPHTRINPHKGYSKIILRNHLPLIVPDGNQCGIKVGDQTHYWKTGELVVFDDSYEHEAWNSSDEVRVVLMFDIAKPNCGYNAKQICRYKLERIEDPFLLNFAPIEKWLEWFEKGKFEVYTF